MVVLLIDKLYRVLSKVNMKKDVHPCVFDLQLQKLKKENKTNAAYIQLFYK